MLTLKQRSSATQDRTRNRNIASRSVTFGAYERRNITYPVRFRSRNNSDLIRKAEPERISQEVMQEQLQAETIGSTYERPDYRADINGLRGLAVSSVVLYHYFGGLFSGGFIGVDVFFVISGYLLSEIIITDVRAGDFRFSKFYERRIRRIFPALFFLLACSTVFAWLFLLPSDMISFSHSLLAASLSASNFYFEKTSNYFDAPAATVPLLHTWSLAVEEQFYIVLPIFLVLTHRYLRRYMRAIIILAALISFVWSVYEVRSNPGAAFLLPFGRAWELLVGTVLALRIIPVPRSQVLRELLSGSGIIGIFAPVFIFTQNTRFPGEYALVPCAASAAIILSGQDQGTTLGSWLLSRRTIVFLGLISYSLYLWHWPLLVFSKIAVFRTFDVPAIGTHLVLAIVAIILATVSWRYVESPFRKGPRRPGKRSILIFGALCVTAFCALAVALSSTGGISGRFPASAYAMADYLDYTSSHPVEAKQIFRLGSCFLERRESVDHFDEGLCLAPGTRKSKVLLFGDSHAANLYYGLETAVAKTHFLQATSSSCPPTFTQSLHVTPECLEFVRRVYDQYIPREPITMVLLNAQWSPTDLDRIGDSVDLLRRRGLTIVIFGPLPTYDTALPRLMAKSIANGRVDFAPLHLDSTQLTLDAEMEKRAKENWHVQYVSLIKILCSKKGCQEYAAPGVPLEFDMSHLTLEGSLYLGHEIATRYPQLFEAK